MERFKNITIIFLLAVVLPASAALSQSASVLLQEGLHAEQIKGDLDAAIKVYERVLKDFPKNRPVAAKALLHIGLCYEKLGEQEAQKAYERVVQEFSDQQKIVAEARTRLSKLTRLASAVQAEDIVIRKLMDASGAGFHGGGEPSPDGKYFCFIDWETYPHDIVIKEIGTREEIRLRAKGDLSYEGHVGIPYFPTWSPDSKKIAYTWESDEGLYIELRVIEIDNPEPDVLIRVDYFKGWVTAVDWSPDGQHILVLHSENDQDQLGLISIVDHSFHTLKKFDYSMPSAAKFSPDGHHIAYDLPPNKENDNHDIYVLSVDGRRQVKLTSHPSHDYLIDWSPTGKKILFASDRTGTMDVWSISFDGGAPQGEPKLITENIGVITPLGCTRNGSFYFSTPGSWWDIYTVTIDPNTGKIAEPPVEVPLPYQGYNKHPAWSPNGKYLAYVSMRELQRRKNILCIYSIETGKIQEFSYKHNISHPRWFFDSKSILVSGTDILKIDTGKITPFIQEKEGQSVYSPNISPDKQHLYYVRGDKNLKINSIISRDLETGKEKELYRTVDDNFTTALSPDGKQLALLSRHKENTRILKILSILNGSVKEIHKFKLKEYRHISMAWSPDGRYIYFSKGKDKWELWRIPATGGTSENLGVKMHGFASISFHPDGRRITFASFVGFERPGGIWIMENFLPVIEPKVKVVRQVWDYARMGGKGNMGKPSPDGRYLLYADMKSINVCTLEFATKKMHFITKEKVPWEISDNPSKKPVEFHWGHSIWSPDGKKVAYSWRKFKNVFVFNDAFDEKVNIKDSFKELRTTELDGSNTRVLYSDDNLAQVRPLDWSSDGQHILAEFYREDKTRQLVKVSVADSSVRVLKTFDKLPRKDGLRIGDLFSPDGRHVVFDSWQKDSSKQDIHILSTDGSREAVLVEHPADDFVLGWTPDGKCLIFASDRTG
ncbi:MAG: tetratricopeptide repeat protein, partial [Planctomycetota bacterium]